MKKLIALLLALAMICGLVACGNNDAPAADAPAADAPAADVPVADAPADENPEPIDYKDVEFRASWWGGDARHNTTIEWLEGFESEHNNLTIDVEYAGFGDYWTKLATQAAGHELPDFMQMSFAYVGEYANNGLLLPLDDYIADGTIDFTNIDESMVSSGIINDQMVAIPTGVCVAGYVYNPELLEQVGVTISKTPTMDEFIDVAKKVYDATGAVTVMGDYDTFFRAYGEELFTADGKAIGVSADAVVELFKFWADGMEYGYLMGPDTAITDPESGLANGQMWSTWLASNLKGGTEQNTGLKLEYFAHPSTDANPAVSCFQPTMMWCVSADTENKDLAVELMNYYFNNTATYDLVAMDRGVPVSSAIREYLAPTMTEADVEMIEFHDYLTENDKISNYNLINPKGWTEVTALLAEYVERVQYGMLTEADFEAAAAEFIAKANELISSLN